MNKTHKILGLAAVVLLIGMLVGCNTYSRAIPEATNLPGATVTGTVKTDVNMTYVLGGLYAADNTGTFMVIGIPLRINKGAVGSNNGGGFFAGPADIAKAAAVWKLIGMAPDADMLVGPSIECHDGILGFVFSTPEVHAKATGIKVGDGSSIIKDW